MDIKLPNLGEGADSGTVVNLFVKEGDQIKKDQPILELENEKAVATIPSTSAGKVAKIHVQVGNKISVGQTILTLTEDSGSKPVEKESVSHRPEERQPREKEPASVEEPEQASAHEPPPIKEGVPPAASPSIRKIARDLGIDLWRVRGSEAGGRIVLSDVRAYIQRLQSLQSDQRAKAPARPSASGTAQKEPVDFAKWGPIDKKPLSPLRQVIARRMSESWTTVPRVTQFDEADITALMELRKKHSATYETQGVRLTITPFVLQVLVQTLKKHALLNSSIDEAAQQIIIKQYYHIGIAVDTEAGLIVPILRDVDKKDLVTISRELEELAEKARTRKISGDELKGGTFTLSNQGGIGSGHFTPIINLPEVAILGLGRGSLKPVVRDKKVEPRLMAPLALSYDHRVIDGAAAARFMVDFVKHLESFGEREMQESFSLNPKT